MAIYQVGNEQFEIDDAISPEQAIQSINSIIAGRDNAFQFSYDAAREMTGGGLETLGNLSEKYLGGDLGVSEYGEDLRKRAAEDIKEGGYVPKYQGDFLDQRSLGDAVGYIGEGIAQNAFSGGAAIAGGGATALAGIFSMPAAIVLGGATLVGSAVLGTGETANEMRDKTGQVNEELAAGAGLLIGFLDKFGAGKLFSKSELVDMTMGQLVDELQKKGYRRVAEELTKETLKRAGSEGVTEATQDLAVVGATAATGGEYTPSEVVNRAINAGVIGTGQGGIVAGTTQAVTMGVTGTQSTKHLSKLDTEAQFLREIGMETDNPDVLAAANQLNIAVEQARNGDLTLLKEIADAEQNADQVPVDDSNRESRAQASFAARLQSIAEDGDALSGKPLDLQDVDPGSESGARKAIETAHGQISGQITELIAILKGRLDPKQSDTLSELFDRSDVKQALKFSRNKVKKSFPNSAFEKLGELTSGTREGDLLRNLVLESMELTRVHNEGYVGGLSGFVDKYINPFSNAGSYNSKAQMANGLRFVGSAVAGTASGGITLLAQLGLIGGSRAFDALTGGRSAVGTYVNQNIDNTRLGVDPSLPSLFEQQKSLQATQREQDMLIQALTANLNLTPAAGPEFAILKTVQDAVQVYEGETVELGPQDIEAANEDLLKTLGEQYRPFYNLIKNRTLENQLPRELMKVVTDLILSKKRSEIRANRQTENRADATELRGVINNQREAGKRDNIAFVQELRNQLNEDAKISAVVKGRVLTVLDEFGRNLGTEPVKSIDQAIKKITSGKTPVPQEVVDAYLNPYRERVVRQQEQNNNAENIATNIEGKGQKNEVFDPETNMLVDNLDAATLLAKKEGYTNDQIEETLRETVRGRKGNDNIPSAGRPAIGVLQGTDSTGTQEETNFNEPVLSAATDQTVGPPADVIIPTPHEVKDKAELATALFEVGKEGSPYEFGVDNAADITRLIEAFNVVLRTYTSQSKMFKESGYPGGAGTYGRFLEGGILGEVRPTIQAMKAGFPKRKVNQLGHKRASQTETGSLLTMLHEFGHYLEGTSRRGRSSMSRSIFGPNYETMITRRPHDGKYGIPDDSIAPGSFTQLLTQIVNAAYDDNATDLDVYDVVGQVSKGRAIKIATELDNLQENTEFFFQNRPELSPEFVREDANLERRAKKSEAIYDDLFNKASEADRQRFKTKEAFLRKDAESSIQFRAQYIRNPAETGTDPLWVYIGNPQLAKEVMPETTKLIREFLNDSPLTKGILTFYSSPIATAVAAALGLLAVNGPGGEEEEMPMPMSGTPATGMLTI